MIKVAYFINAAPDSGVGRRAAEISHRLTNFGIAATNIILDGENGMLTVDKKTLKQITAWPGMFGKKSVNWLRLGRAAVALKEIKEHQVFHLTNQSLGFLAKKVSPTVVTVHDLIELTDPQNGLAALLNRRLYNGINRADKVICVSNFTRQAVTKHLSIPSDKTVVIPNGVSADFHPIAGFNESVAYLELRRRMKINSGQRPVVIYVGSEHPRKNLPAALQAFDKLRRNYPDSVFIKVGKAGLPQGRRETLEAVDKLNLKAHFRLVEDVSLAQLNEIYNLADVLIHPAWLEGFGLTILEAMAAGTPVVCSNTTSLPEVAGHAGLLNHPDDIDGFAKSLELAVGDKQRAEQMREAGLKRAAEFTWDKAASMEAEVYRQLV